MEYKIKKAITDDVEKAIDIVEKHFSAMKFEKLNDITHVVQNLKGSYIGKIVIENICDSGSVTLMWHPSAGSKLYAPKDTLVFDSSDDIPDSAAIAKWVLGIQTDLGM